MAHDDADDPTFGLLPEDDEALTQHLCAECGVLSPPTRTAYTLIGKAHGWRVTRYPAPPRPGVARSWRFEWHCPTCWPAVRSSRGESLADGGSGNGHPGRGGADDGPAHDAAAADGTDGPGSPRR